jgi:(2Fe-2S) ferredoxin
VILLGPGGNNTGGRARLRAAAAALAARRPEVAVVAAVLVPGKTEPPGLGEAAERLIAGGAAEVAVLPCFLEWDYPEQYDGPDQLYDLAAAHPEVRFRLARTLAGAPEVEAALLERLDEAWSLPDAATATVRQTAAVAGQTPVGTAALPAGETPRLPAHAAHVFVCLGRRCMEAGSAAAYRELQAALAARGLDGGAARVKVTRTKCLSPCAGAPVVCVYPQGTFHAHLDAGAVGPFVERVLVAGEALPGHTFRPGA